MEFGTEHVSGIGAAWGPVLIFGAWRFYHKIERHIYTSSRSLSWGSTQVEILAARIACDEWLYDI